MGKSDKDIIEDMSRNPFYMSLTKEEFELMKQDEEIKDRVFDIRDRLEDVKQQAEFNQLLDDIGGFISIRCDNGTMLDDRILSQEDKSKIILLSTYMGSDNILKFDNNVKIKLKHMPELLKISRQATYTFLKKVKKIGIIISNDGGTYSISKNILRKGKAEWEFNENCDFGNTRIFINSYRYLYDTLDKRKLRYLGTLINILGYINVNHNILVADNKHLFEDNHNNIIPMPYDKMYEICNGKSNVDQSTKIRFRYALENIKLENGQKLFTFSKENGIEKILVNPNILYKGCNIDAFRSTLEVICENEKYNGRTSFLSAYLRCKITPWVNKMKKEQGNKCAITGIVDDSNVVHHIYSFNLIVENAIKTLEQTVYDDIYEYTEEELEKLSDLTIKLHYDNIDGVVITKEIHIEFHKKYGYGYNTLEQWEEFKNSYDISQTQ